MTTAEGIIAAGFKIHGEEHDEGGIDQKQYHESLHLDTVVHHMEKILIAIDVSSKDQYLTLIAIAWHDKVLSYQHASSGELLEQISRFRGARASDLPSGSEGSEAQSARAVAQHMRDANKQVEIFTEDDIRVVTLAIEFTFPEFKLAKFADYPYYAQALENNPKLIAAIGEMREGGTRDELYITQPHFDEALEAENKIPRPALIMAVADLATSGMESASDFFNEGDAECRELHENLRDPKRLETISEIECIKVKNMLLNWLDGQPGFVAWQALRFEKLMYRLNEKNELSQSEIDKMRLHFCQFENNIRASMVRAQSMRETVENFVSQQGEKAALISLMKTMGFTV